ncbi:hypothetical protein Sru01_66070 [Sphaerisporangium rufum]|uniref:Uncharacterized protein n=1 Tax=Sphaerisporangium rufum TaxID=1381558 RepID=A0A919RBD7_9ACTN|nr:hypothetical protein Sru01_66070 [Sphaerisporangium rufum]
MGRAAPRGIGGAPAEEKRRARDRRDRPDPPRAHPDPRCSTECGNLPQYGSYVDRGARGRGLRNGSAGIRRGGLLGGRPAAT